MLYDDFIGLYSLSKTLRFELKPIGKTLEYIRKNKHFPQETGPDIFEKDWDRNCYYDKMKELLDQAHKKLLQDALSDFNKVIPEKDREWEKLEKAYIQYQHSDRNKNDKKILEDTQLEFRKKIVEALKHDANQYNKLTEATPKKFIKAQYENNPQSHAFKVFNGFATYFAGFQKNRQNIYTHEAVSVAVANRAINDNFPKFMECCHIFSVIRQKYPQIIEQVENSLRDFLDGEKLDEIFQISAYGNVLSQRDIDKFNTLIGGISGKETDRKKAGINEMINLYRQHDEKAKDDSSLKNMPRLYKQILNDREQVSFIAEMFTDDDTVIETLIQYGKHVCNQIEPLKQLIMSIPVDAEDIYICAKDINEISYVLSQRWDTISNLIEKYVQKLMENTTEKEQKILRQYWDKREEYSLSEFKQFNVNFVDYWKSSDKNNKIFSLPVQNYQKMLVALEEREKGCSLAVQETLIMQIKEFLDSVQALYRFVKPFNAGKDLERNGSFYQQFDFLFDELKTIVPLYNKVRNYITKKPGETKKIKLMFDTPTLGSGWDKNKEKDNKCVIFRKDEQYYLGIIREKSLNFDNLSQESPNNCYQKMVYKLLPDPMKMFPKVFFAESNKAKYIPDDTLYARYKAGDHKKTSKNFDLHFCHELIDFFKNSIQLNSDWNIFNFRFSPTETYEDINEFYRDVEQQNYKISFINIPTAQINDMVERGYLLLFQIWNKDFSSDSHGRENMHTLYWRQLFTAENLQTVKFRLNGGAELFYRSASLPRKIVHNVGEKMLNRRDKEGHTIPNAIYLELYNYINQKGNQLLSQEASAYLDKIVVKTVKHSIIKDKHFTEDKFLFHVPITINAGINDYGKMNDKVNACVKENLDKIRYIGLDRGERHLIYLTMIDAYGKILIQKSYNTIQSITPAKQVQETNYHQKLDDKEHARADARKNWQTIDQIKDLKKGYLSQVVHDIAKMIVNNNAVVVLEDLNFGFKRGRFHIEKQVYQNFEKALIEKLNYLVFKDRNANEAGGVRNGYQLTAPFMSFERLGKQSGILYYVPAGYTSKIDPTTGFINLFTPIQGADNIQKFFENFDAIFYDEEKDTFVFDFDYGKFKAKDIVCRKWRVYTAKRRLCYNKTSSITEEVNPIAIIKEQMKNMGVQLSDGYDVKALMQNINPKKEAYFFSQIYFAFTKTLQMRNSSSQSGEDYIESPVLNQSGTFFDSRTASADLPQDADANGAYHIALKGMCMLNRLKEQIKEPVKITPVKNVEWFEFAQSRHRK